MTDILWQKQDEKRDKLMNEFIALNGSHGTSRSAKIALAWHDVVCPEAEDCRDRAMHAASHPIAYGGLLDRFIENCKAMDVEL